MITYAGVPLLLPDAEGELAKFLDHYLPLEAASILGPPWQNNQFNTPFATGHRTGFGIPNYPPPPPVKINSLYWPTGAGRFSRFFGLCTTSQLSAIFSQDALRTYIPSAMLVLNDEDRFSLGARMTPLPPRQLSVTFPGEEAVWLLPLVDIRYSWQFNVGGTASKWYGPDQATDVTWENQLAFNAAVHNWSDLSVPAAYGSPDWQEGQRYHHHVGQVFDAICHSIGHRFVRQISGRQEILDWDTSDERFQDNLAAAGYKVYAELAGGDFSDSYQPGKLPYAVLVHFPIYEHGRTRQMQFDPRNNAYDSSSYRYHTETRFGVNFVENEDDLAVGFARQIVTTAGADYTNARSGLGNNPSNQSDITSLADQIVTDLFASLRYQYDRTFASIKPWQLTGYDDYVEWSFGYRNPDGSYAAQTRVCSHSYNFGVHQMFHRIGETWAHRPNYAHFGNVDFDSKTLTTATTSGGSYLSAQTETGDYILPNGLIFFSDDALSGNPGFEFTIGGDWLVLMTIGLHAEHAGTGTWWLKANVHTQVNGNGLPGNNFMNDAWQEAGTEDETKFHQLAVSGILRNIEAGDVVQFPIGFQWAGDGQLSVNTINASRGSVVFQRID